MRTRTLLWIPSFILAMIAPATAQVVEEPPIPVTIICPYHEDSLRRAYEAGLGGARPGSSTVLDSVGRGLIESTRDLSDTLQNSFLLVYFLLGIVAIMTLAALRVAYRLRLEIQEVRDERRLMPLALQSPTVVESRPILSARGSRPAPKKRTPPSTRRVKRKTARRQS